MTDPSANPTRLLVSDVPISFWGGVDPVSGDVIDEHHPLHGDNVVGNIVAIPGSRGSCSGSGVLLELIMTSKAPAALVFSEQEEILVLGALVAQIMFDRPMPLLLLDAEDFAQLNSGGEATVVGDTLSVKVSSSSQVFHGKRLDIHSLDFASDFNANPDIKPEPSTEPIPRSIARTNVDSTSMVLDAQDHEKLAGKHGKAVQVAMQIMLSMARIQGARDLISITQAHIDSCVYHGPSSLLFAQTFVGWGATVAVPTTLNSVSVDKRRWQAQGIEPVFGNDASALGDAYMDMGAQLSYTCAPYLLDTAPVFGEQIVWAESNAVAYANSVLGARTQKYPDFLDVCIALTGRAPNTGAHLDSGRVPTIQISVTPPQQFDDAYWPLLGYHIGLLAENDIPLVFGLEATSPTTDNLKAFSAAFATTSSAPLFHLASITPEALSGSASLENFTNLALPAITLATQDMSSSWKTLNSAPSNKVDMVCLGNPHFSFTECQSLAQLCEGKTRSPDVAVVVTLGRAVHAQCDEAGITNKLQAFGVQLVNDTCWCMLQAPVIPPEGSLLMTNSAKYAHYAPGLVNRAIHFGSLADCIDTACAGERMIQQPEWL